MTESNRRSFFRQSVLGAGALATMANSVQAREDAKPKGNRYAHDRVELVDGVKVSRLAMGTGVKGGARVSDHTRMGQKNFNQVVYRGFDKGLNFFDLADLYGTHPFVKNALTGIPRDDYALLTKLWFRKENWNKPSGGATEEVYRFCKELGTDYLDIMLIHCTTNDRWTSELQRVRDEMSEMKEKGMLRGVGVSCHDHGALKIAAEDPWTEVIFARINNKGVKMDGTPEEISTTIRKARANGKAVVGMKIFGEGELVRSDQKDSSLNYVLGNELVNAMTIGMKSSTEIDDTVERIDKTFNA